MVRGVEVMEGMLVAVLAVDTQCQRAVALQTETTEVGVLGVGLTL